MPKYISLFKYTEQGIRDVRESAARVRRDSSENEQFGVTLTSLFLTLGEYDFVGFWDAPNDEAMAAVLLHHGRKGNISTTTMRAFTLDEFTEIVGKLE